MASWTCRCGARVPGSGYECPDCGYEKPTSRKPRDSALAAVKPYPEGRGWPRTCQWYDGCQERPSIWVDGEKPYCSKHWDLEHKVPPERAGLPLHTCVNPRPPESWYDGVPCEGYPIPVRLPDSPTPDDVKAMIRGLIERLSVPMTVKNAKPLKDEDLDDRSW